MTSTSVSHGVDGIDLAPEQQAPGTSRWQKAVGALGLLVVLWVGSQMYNVIFFDGTFPGAGTGSAPSQEAPAPGAEHTPPRGGH